VEEALEKVKVSIRNLKEFKTTFQDYKARLPSYFTGDKSPKTWEFQVRRRLPNIFDCLTSVLHYPLLHDVKKPL
jgi:hypothetical protein